VKVGNNWEGVSKAQRTAARGPKGQSRGVVLGKRALGRGTKPSPHQLGGLGSAVSSQAG